ncbi:hypothetical protein GCM10023170_093580 [Phytohabitans houttuyneae]|uniref:Uncharacterized protein n=1 Tax=Phytohabitans houttuyneae TaxID=1076126 RepID=A0A6V8KIL2_9ACTN|nr:hypothetical protein Phou_078540 [Phytohabitans houttuyneae]
MAAVDQLLASIAERLRGRPVPDDLRRLAAIQAERPADAGRSRDPLLHTRTVIFEPGESHALLDHSYLTDNDRADPDIMANIAAIDTVLLHAAWIGTLADGDVVGYWLHPDEPVGEPPLVVTFSTEGEFDIRPGESLVEAVIYHYAGYEDDRFASVADLYEAHGLPITARRADDLLYRRAVVNPGVLHSKRYEQECAARGLS